MVDPANPQPIDLPESKTYQAFLLRCWRESDTELQGEAAWRFALVPAGDEGRIRAFSSLEDLIVYLRQELHRSA